MFVKGASQIDVKHHAPPKNNPYCWFFQTSKDSMNGEVTLNTEHDTSIAA